MKTLLLFAFLLGTSLAQAMPSKIILIRHGEEPSGEEGTELSPIGWQRAEALPQLFGGEIITHLIALKPHKKKGSIRAIQTLQPLSAALGIEIRTPYTRDEVSDLAQLLNDSSEYDGQVVLISWQHATLPDLASALGAQDVPNKWGGNVFDRYWVLEYQNGKFTSFKNLPQRLLHGDSNE